MPAESTAGGTVRWGWAPTARMEEIGMCLCEQVAKGVSGWWHANFPTNSAQEIAHISWESVLSVNILKRKR